MNSTRPNGSSLESQARQLKVVYPGIDASVAEDLIRAVGFDASVQFLASEQNAGQEEPTLYTPASVYEPVVIRGDPNPPDEPEYGGSTASSESYPFQTTRDSLENVRSMASPLVSLLAHLTSLLVFSFKLRLMWQMICSHLILRLLRDQEKRTSRMFTIRRNWPVDLGLSSLGTYSPK